MAAALLGDVAGDRVEVCYFTEHPGSLDEAAVAALAELGVNAEDYRVGTTLQGAAVDLVVVIDQARCSAYSVDVTSDLLPPVLAGLVTTDGSSEPVPRIGWPVEDPSQARGDVAVKNAFRRARSQLSEHVDVLVDQGYLNILVQAAQRSNNHRGAQ